MESFLDGRVTLYGGDCLEILDTLPEDSIDSVVTDPPYHLTSIVKRFGADGAAEAKSGKTGAYRRASAGFMGKQWDGGDIAFRLETWAKVFRALKPGGYIVAFSSSRTYHHMAVAMEQAGFITHPMIGWVYSTGFPKAHNAARAVDKVLGAEGSPEAEQWQGWSYGGQVRKPALEPIYVGQKPFSEKSGALNILKHGVGAVNVDGCRVPSAGGKQRNGESSQSRRYTEKGSTNFGLLPGPRGGGADGRWPANLILDGSPEVVALFPDSKGQMGPSGRGERGQGNCYGRGNLRKNTPPRGDDGSAARFFESYPFEDAPIFYCAKASKKDRAGSRHPTIKPVALIQGLIRHVTPPGGVTLDPFAGSGTCAAAAVREGMRAILIEKDEQSQKDIASRLDGPEFRQSSLFQSAAE